MNARKTNIENILEREGENKHLKENVVENLTKLRTLYTAPYVALNRTEKELQLLQDCFDDLISNLLEDSYQIGYNVCLQNFAMASNTVEGRKS